MYAKVYRSLWDGTLGPDWKVWSTFLFMLAHCDIDGILDMTQEAIAARSGIPLDQVRQAIKVLEAPDPRSRSAAEDGRRLILLDEHRDWGWMIVNYGEYRSRVDAEVVRAQTKERVRRFKERKKRKVTDGNATKRQAEAEAEESGQPPVDRGVGESTESGEPPCLELGVEEGSGGGRMSLTAWFDEVFWPQYPRHVKKQEALTEMKRIFKGVRGEAEDRLGDAIMAGLAHWKAGEWRNRDPDKIEHARTWLHNRRWTDAEG